MSIAEKLTTVAENQQRVHDAGKQAEYDAFWDGYLDNGQANKFEYYFAGRGWNDETFKPKYDLVLGIGYTGTYMFASCGVTDLKAALARCGKTLDTSKSGFLGSLFMSSSITHIPTIDMSNATYSGGTALVFSSPNIVSIDKVIFSESTDVQSNTFNAQNLESVMFDGVIGKSGLSVQNCTKLSHDSLMSLLNTLQTKTSGTWTCTLGTANLEKLTDAEKAIATEKGWTLA